MAKANFLGHTRVRFRTLAALLLTRMCARPAELAWYLLRMLLWCDFLDPSSHLPWCAPFRCFIQLKVSPIQPLNSHQPILSLKLNLTKKAGDLLEQCRPIDQLLIQICASGHHNITSQNRRTSSDEQSKTKNARWEKSSHHKNKKKT